jgi:hypothetical protein
MRLSDLSDAQIQRIYNRILERIHGRHTGDPYGVDARTLALIDPPLCRAYWTVLAEGRRRVAMAPATRRP